MSFVAGYFGTAGTSFRKQRRGDHRTVNGIAEQTPARTLSFGAKFIANDVASKYSK